MKTISFALVSAGLLALTACGGGNKANNSTTSTNTAETTEIGNTSTLPPVDLGTTNDAVTYGGDTNTSLNAGAGAGNTTVTNTSTTTTNSH